MARSKISYVGKGSTSTYIEGLDDVKDLLNRLNRDAPTKFEEIIDKYGEKIKASLLGNIHSLKNTKGTLERSVKLVTKYTVKSKIAIISMGGAKAPHAHLVEFGHEMIGHKPKKKYYGDVSGKNVIRNAFEDNVEKLYDELIDMLDEIIL